MFVLICTVNTTFFVKTLCNIQVTLIELNAFVNVLSLALIK